MAVNFGSAVPIRALVLGGRGGIGGAFVSLLRKLPNTTFVGCTSRDKDWVADFNRQQAGDNRGNARVRAFPVDLACEDSFDNFNKELKKQLSQRYCDLDANRLNVVINASGFLHDTDVRPETTLRRISKQSFTENFNGNTLSNFLAARYILGDKDLVHISKDTGDSAGQQPVLLHAQSRCTQAFTHEQNLRCADSFSFASFYPIAVALCMRHLLWPMWRFCSICDAVSPCGLHLSQRTRRLVCLSRVQSGNEYACKNCCY